MKTASVVVMVVVRWDSGLCAGGSFRCYEVDADECCDAAECEFQDSGGGCRVEVFVEDGGA